MWMFAAEELGKDLCIDAGIPKTNAEYIISASAFTPGGVPQETCPVSVRIGELEKTIYVVGDRFWRGQKQTKPQPFTQMPITWDRAFGGEGFDRNPLGKGFQPVETEHGPIQFLPNLEIPGKMITTPKQTPNPMGFGPVDLMWPQRSSKVGTYDQKWLKQDFPGFARDMDWTFHNIAPQDQQQATFFTGIESFEFMNLHPTIPKIKGKLPGLRTRTFVTQRKGGNDVFLELDTNLTTLWFFPHALRGILVFQGSHVCSEDDASDITHLMVASEALREEKSISHYQDVLAKRLDKDTAIVYALREQDLLHSGATENIPEDDLSEMMKLITPEFLLKKNLTNARKRRIEESRENVASYGLDPDEHGPKVVDDNFEMPTDLSEIFEMQKDAINQAEEDKKRAENRVEQMMQDIEPDLVSAGYDPQMIRDEISQGKTGPPEFTADGEIERIRGLAKGCRDLGTPVDELEDWATNEEIHQSWREAEQKIRDAYVLAAHFQDPVPVKSEAESEQIRGIVLKRYLSRESFSYFDLSGANLSGLDLRGADFRNGWLESVDFTGADLSGASFENAVLARANLTNATCHLTNFNGANLARANLTNFIGKDNRFNSTNFFESNLTNADFSDATIDKADFFSTKLNNAKFTGAHCNSIFFSKVETKNLDFSLSTLKKVSFVECDVSDADFGGADFEAVTFAKCVGRCINFKKIKAENFAVLQSESFKQCDFRGANIKTLNLRGVDLQECDFSGANLQTIDLSEANLERAKFYRTVTREARFIKANLQEANMTSIDLIEADMQKADIRGTNFLGANLYAANFGKVYSDDKTILTGANQNKVTIYPLRHQ